MYKVEGGVLSRNPLESLTPTPLSLVTACAVSLVLFMDLFRAAKCSSKKEDK